MNERKVTATVDKSIITEIEKKISGNNLRLSGRHGVAKMIYDEIVKRGFVSLLNDKKYYDSVIGAVVDKTGIGEK